MNNLLQDIAYSLRMLRKQPAITALAVIALALGIGANTAVFSVVNAVLLHPLPVKDPETLLTVWAQYPRKGDTLPFSVLNFADLHGRVHSFEQVAAMTDLNFSLAGKDGAIQVEGLRASGEFFSALGVSAMLGRTFQAGDDQPGSPPVAVIGYGLWQRRFGSDPKALGQTISLNGKAYQVIGVMPRLFDFPVSEDLWIPLVPTADELAPQHRGDPTVMLVARLKRGVTPESARAEMHAVASALAQEYPDANAGMDLIVSRPVSQELADDYRNLLLVLQGAAAFVLLIACANIANLLLARASARRKEIAIRAALGATRERLIRQLLTENAVLATAGGLFGALLALQGVDLILAMIPQGDLPLYWMEHIRVDGGALAFTALVALTAGLLSGLAPAWTLSRLGLVEQMQDGGRGGTGGAARHHLRNSLVVSEVALVLVLLIGAGLMLRTLQRLHRVNPGFDPANVIFMRISLPEVPYKVDSRQVSFVSQLVARVSALPVSSAAIINEAPIDDSAAIGPMMVRGMSTLAKDDDYPTVGWRTITPAYFATMRIQLAAGRGFTDQDTASSAPVCIVSRALVTKFRARGEFLGQQIKVGGPKDPHPWMTVVGIAGDVVQFSLGSDPPPLVYIPFQQRPGREMNLMIRAAGDPGGSVRAIISELDPALAPGKTRTMQQRIAESLSGELMMSKLLGTFGLVALLLSALGIYAVISYSVTERTREIGIRMALGAQQAQVLRMVVRQGLRLVGGGLAIGLAGAWALTRLLSNMLYGVTPTDPVVFGAICTLLTVVAAAASLLPARRATRVDPLVALRYE